jgi:pentatricopeptide repeat protein
MKQELILLGNPRLQLDSTPILLQRRRAMALLAYLAVTRQSHARDMLVTLIYPELDESAGRAELRRILSALKTALPEDILIIDRESVGLSDRLEVDIQAFDEAVATDTVESLSTAVRLYGDAFMTGFTLTNSSQFDDWQFEQREYFRHKFVRAIRRLVDHHSDQKYDTAIHYARRWLSQDSLDERAYRTLMRLYVRSGQPGVALRLYEECSRVLLAELHIQPVERIILRAFFPKFSPKTCLKNLNYHNL